MRNTSERIALQLHISDAWRMWTFTFCKSFGKCVHFFSLFIEVLQGKKNRFSKLRHYIRRVFPLSFETKRYFIHCATGGVIYGLTLVSMDTRSANIQARLKTYLKHLACQKKHIDRAPGDKTMAEKNVCWLLLMSRVCVTGTTHSNKSFLFFCALNVDVCWKCVRCE